MARGSLAWLSAPPLFANASIGDVLVVPPCCSVRLRWNSGLFSIWFDRCCFRGGCCVVHRLILTRYELFWTQQWRVIQVGMSLSLECMQSKVTPAHNRDSQRYFAVTPRPIVRQPVLLFLGRAGSLTHELVYSFCCFHIGSTFSVREKVRYGMGDYEELKLPFGL